MAFNIKIKSKNKQVTLQKVIQGDKTLYIPLLNKELKDVSTNINSTLLQKTLVYDNTINDGNEITEPVVGQITVVEDITSTSENISDIINPFNVESINFDDIKDSSWWNIEHDTHNVYPNGNDLSDNYIHGYTYYPINGAGATFNDLIMSAKWEEGISANNGNYIIPNVSKLVISHSFCIGFAQKYELVKNDILDYNEPITVSRLSNVQKVMLKYFNINTIRIPILGTDPVEMVTGYAIPIYAKYYFNINKNTLKILDSCDENVKLQIINNEYYEIKPIVPENSSITSIRDAEIFSGAYVHVGIKPEYLAYYEQNLYTAIPLNHLLFNTANILHTSNNYIPYNINLDNDNISKWKYKSDILILADNKNENNINNCILIKLNDTIYQDINAIAKYNIIQLKVGTIENPVYTHIIKTIDNNILIEYTQASLIEADIPSNYTIPDTYKITKLLYNSEIKNFIDKHPDGCGFDNLSGLGIIVGYAVENNGVYQPVFTAATELLTERTFAIMSYNTGQSKKMLKECPYTDITYYNQLSDDIITSAIPKDTNIRYLVSNISNSNLNDTGLPVILGYILNEDNINETTPSRRVYWIATKTNITQDYIYRISLLLNHAILNTLYLIHNAMIYNIVLYYDINNTSDNALITNINAYRDFIQYTNLQNLRLTTPFYQTNEVVVVDTATGATALKNYPLKNYTVSPVSLNTNKTELTYQIYIKQNHEDKDTLITLDNGTTIRCMEYHLLIPNGKYSIEVLKELNWCISFAIRYKTPINGNYNNTTLQIPLNQLSILSDNDKSQYILTKLHQLCYFIVSEEYELDNELAGIGETIEAKMMVGFNQDINDTSKAYNYANIITNLTNNKQRLATYSTSFSKLLYPENEDDKKGQTVFFTIHLDYIETDNGLITIIN